MLITDDWTIVFNPRTGSRSLADGLRQCGFDVTHKHVRPEHVIGETVWGVIRNPVHWVWSYYFTSKQYPHKRFEQWIDENWQDVGLRWSKGPHVSGLNIYRNVITHYWLYERGIAGLLRHLGFRGFTLPTIGYKPKPIAPYCTAQISRYFADDVNLYNDLLYSQEYR